MQDAMKQSTQTVAVMLGSVALISLIVGAIGTRQRDAGLGDRAHPRDRLADGRRRRGRDVL